VLTGPSLPVPPQGPVRDRPTLIGISRPAASMVTFGKTPHEVLTLTTTPPTPVSCSFVVPQNEGHCSRVHLLPVDQQPALLRPDVSHDLHRAAFMVYDVSGHRPSFHSPAPPGAASNGRRVASRRPFLQATLAISTSNIFRKSGSSIVVARWEKEPANPSYLTKVKGLWCWDSYSIPVEFTSPTAPTSPRSANTACNGVGGDRA
jgi:hypothetical protein